MVFSLFRRLWRSVAGEDKPLNKTEFTAYGARLLRRKYGRRHVRIVEDLFIKLAQQGSAETELHLDNVYATYLLVPQALDDILAPFPDLKPSLTVEELEQPSALARLLPVIRSQPFLDYVEKSYNKNSGAVLYAEPFCADLYTLYVVDYSDQMHFITGDQIAALPIALDDIRQTALANLRRMIPQLKAHPLPGSYMLEADGNYESSLLLLDNMWDGTFCGLAGDLVVAVPARGLVFVTVAASAEGMQVLREQARTYYQEGHAISPHLFVRRCNGWELLE